MRNFIQVTVGRLQEVVDLSAHELDWIPTGPGEHVRIVPSGKMDESGTIRYEIHQRRGGQWRPATNFVIAPGEIPDDWSDRLPDSRD